MLITNTVSFWKDCNIAFLSKKHEMIQDQKKHYVNFVMSWACKFLYFLVKISFVLHDRFNTGASKSF